MASEFIPCVRYGKVVSIADETGSDMITVRLSPDDNTLADNEIKAKAFPFMPKMFHVKPKEGEGVFVLTAIGNNGHSQRFYIGPVISQDHRMFKDPFFMGGDSFYDGAAKAFDVDPAMNPETYGALPKDEDIVIRGRKNADIQITDDDVRIKAGVKVCNESDPYYFSFNKKNPAYAKFKYHTEALNDGSQSTATIAADKINLFGTSSPNSVNLTDPEDLITDEELNRALEEAYKLPYGEKLVSILKTMIDSFVKHTHNFAMQPPNPAFTETLLKEKDTLLDKEQLLSDSIRIN